MAGKPAARPASAGRGVIRATGGKAFGHLLSARDVRARPPPQTATPPATPKPLRPGCHQTRPPHRKAPRPPADKRIPRPPQAAATRGARMRIAPAVRTRARTAWKRSRRKNGNRSSRKFSIRRRRNKPAESAQNAGVPESYGCFPGRLSNIYPRPHRTHAPQRPPQENRYRRAMPPYRGAVHALTPNRGHWLRARRPRFR